ncbi:hypothetical protein AOZ06_27235 [Kibdelosporangium phytohabitans]|uniref:Uncharacterized protein n=1 Tax=Kibdelosporangium phytohabitans TaxID=860235 RepID=A0A0N9I5F5_9PSEU|nr:hypothetical protein AOZ06_27235 [Kibdelosporangium phytohabitans]
MIVVVSDHDGYERAPRKGDTAGQGVYLAIVEGATTIWTAGRSAWNYLCRVADPEGVERTFGTHRPSEPWGDWS